MKKTTLLFIAALTVCTFCACSAQKVQRKSGQKAAAQTAAVKKEKEPQPAAQKQTRAPAPKEPLPQEPMRGIWITSVSNIDYPSKPALSEEQQKKEFTKILDTLKDLGFNTVVVQVRPAGDTFWPSSLEPCSYYLSGKQGKCPSYDPLAFMIKEAHKRGLSFHAWFNPFRAAQNLKIKMAANNPARKNKEWTVKYGDQLYYNPASKEVRQHSLNVIAEVVKKYDIDAVHLDDYFYPYPITQGKKTIPFPDAKDYKKYQKEGGDLSLEAWRRQNVNIFVRDLSLEVKKIKPQMLFGISPFGVWRNKNKDKSGSDTRAFSSYDSGLYADTRLWIDKGWVDYVVPQLYWGTSHKSAPFGVLLDWWSKEITRNKNVKLYIGLAAYKHGQEWDKNEFKEQLRLIDQTKNIDGIILFSAKPIVDDQSGIQKIIKREFL